MRKVLLYLILLVFCVSCSTDVDIYADYKDIPVIYGLLDYNADTNFVRITHAMGFHEDLGAAAQDPSLTNYPGKLDVRITEFRNKDSIRQIILDTITLHNKQDGFFYAPDQKLYYTTEPLHKNTAGANYTYRLTVKLPDQTVIADEAIVGTDANPFRTTVVDFSGGNKNILFYPVKNAGVYEVRLAFSFLEQRTPESDLVRRTLEWPVGVYYDRDLAEHPVDGAYVVHYQTNDFDYELDRFFGNDTAVPGLTRFLSDYPFQVVLTAGGENFALYLLYNDATHSSLDPENSFTTIEGARGVFSSKTTKTGKMRPGGTTLPDLLHTKYGFRYVGGDF
ncbi:MAG: DUF4249 family protein [Bacteroidales bacterium]|nr:DUF4249 family protein [Bacteroidales bacterium]